MHGKDLQMKTLLPLATILASMFSAAGVAFTSAQAPGKVRDLHVLFIGNSQIFYNDLPRMLEALADSAPAERPRIRAARFVAGGASLETLWKAGDGKGTARAKIREKKWDYVILQDIYLARPDSFNKHAALFHALNQENGSRTLLFCTAGISSQYPKGFQDLHDMHIALKKKLKVPVAAAGKAWLSHWGETPTVQERLALYHSDKAHPGVKGSYIYACTLYAALTGQSPVGLNNRIPERSADSVTATEARRFQEAAWRVHQEINRAAGH